MIQSISHLPDRITGVSKLPRMRVISPTTLPMQSSGMLILTLSIGSSSFEPQFVNARRKAMGVARKKSRGWVWIV